MVNSFYLFTYGTLQDPEVQMEITGRIWNGFESIINGFDKGIISLKSGTYPILKKGNSKIEGIIYEIFESELPLIDLYEGESYKRILTKTFDNIDIYLYICS